MRNPACHQTPQAGTSGLQASKVEEKDAPGQILERALAELEPHWAIARELRTCSRCQDPIPKRCKYYVYSLSSSFCRWCAGEVWGITPRQKEAR